MSMALSICRVVSVLLVSTVAFSAPVGATDRTPDRVARSMTEAGLECVAKHNSRTILCNVHAPASELDKIATGAVAAVRMNDVSMQGWTLMMVNFEDYVVTLPFGD